MFRDQRQHLDACLHSFVKFWQIDIGSADTQDLLHIFIHFSYCKLTYV